MSFSGSHTYVHAGPPSMSKSRLCDTKSGHSLPGSQGKRERSPGTWLSLSCSLADTYLVLASVPKGSSSLVHRKAEWTESSSRVYPETHQQHSDGWVPWWPSENAKHWHFPEIQWRPLCHRLGSWVSWTQLSHNTRTELRCSETHGHDGHGMEA